MVQIEKDAEVARFLKGVASEARVDLEAWEVGLRRVVLAAGGRVLGELLAGVGGGRREKVMCACGARMRSVGQRAKTLQTVMGAVPWRRSLFVCPACGAARFPADGTLGLTEGAASPGLRRLMARAGSKTPFAEAVGDLTAYGEMRVSAREIERVAEDVGREIEAWSRAEAARVVAQARRPGAAAVAKDIPILYASWDGTGVPMRPGELVGRHGKGPDGKARTREAKLGCVFTQTALDDEGRPMRDPASTTYVGAIESSDNFGWRLYAEAVRRGLDRAERVAALTDGASYNKTLAALHFPTALHVIDLSHASEHLHALLRLRFGKEPGAARTKDWTGLLEAGEIETLVRRAGRTLPARGARRKDALGEIHYFSGNATHMRYAEFRKQGLFVGSGVIEAGCRTLIGKRFKQSGMHWSVDGANAIIAVRCCVFSGRFEQFWEDRAA